MPTKNVFISSTTESIMRDDRDYQIKINSKRFNIPEELIRAIIYAETLDTILTAPRFEPHLKRARWYLQHLTKEEKEDYLAFCSLGDMQILFAVAKEMGFQGKPIELSRPVYNIYYGTKHLANLIKQHKGDILMGISAYNQGQVIDSKGQRIASKFQTNGKLKNQKYVDRVIGKYKKYGGSL